MCESQTNISIDYILSVVNDRNLLLTSLSHLLSSQVMTINDQLVTTLIDLYCNHSDQYVRHISGKLVVKYVKSKQNLSVISTVDCWHCLPQKCKLLTMLTTDVDIKSSSQCYLGFELTITHILNVLTSDGMTCEDHCQCYVPKSIDQLLTAISDDHLNIILSNLIKLVTNDQKRCFVNQLLKLLIAVSKDKSNNSLIIQTIGDWIFANNLLSDYKLKVDNTLYSFGGKYCQTDDKQLDNEYGCDVVIIRQLTLLALLILSSDHYLRTNSNEINRNGWQILSQFVRNSCKAFDKNDWIIKVFIEDDEELLCGLYCLIRLGDNQMSHIAMSDFIGSIGSDSSVLIDMLCSEEQTATNLLKLLLIYLKLDDITVNIEMNVKNILLQLRDKIQRLTTKQLFPYNVKPLIKLINNKLKI